MAKIKEVARKALPAIYLAQPSRTLTPHFDHPPVAPKATEDGDEDSELSETESVVDESEEKSRVKNERDNEVADGADSDNEEDEKNSAMKDRGESMATSRGESVEARPTETPKAESRRRAKDPSRTKGTRQYVRVQERSRIKKHLTQFVTGAKAAQVAPEDKLAMLHTQRDAKLTEIERKGAVTTRTHADPKAEETKSEVDSWLWKNFHSYLKGKFAAPISAARQKVLSKQTCQEEPDEGDDEGLPFVKRELREGSGTTVVVKMEHEVGNGKRTWQFRDGKWVVWPPFDDDADSQRWLPKQEKMSWASDGIVKTELKRLKAEEH